MFNRIKGILKSKNEQRADSLVNPNKKSVHVFVPSYPGPKINTMESLLIMVETLPLFRPDYQVKLQLAAGAYVSVLRNGALKRMIEDEDCEGLLFIDHDAVWPTIPPTLGDDGKWTGGFNALDRLMSLDKDVVGGLFTTRQMPVKLMCGGFDPDNGAITWLDDISKGHPLNADLFQVDWIGCHFLYVSRPAALKIAKHVGSHLTLFDCGSRLMIDGRYNKTLDKNLEDYKAGKSSLDLVKLQIESLVDHAGFFQEDVSFCRRAKAAGCEIWVDPKFEVQHVGDYSFGRMDWIAYKAMQEQAEKEEAGAPVEEGLPRIPRLEAVAAN